LGEELGGQEEGEECGEFLHVGVWVGMKLVKKQLKVE
jgi:hypothetical protein